MNLGDARKSVLSLHPGAVCRRVERDFGTHFGRHEVRVTSNDSEPLGVGTTARAAWLDAANRLAALPSDRDDDSTLATTESLHQLRCEMTGLPARASLAEQLYAVMASGRTPTREWVAAHRDHFACFGAPNGGIA